nr:LamG domain-containing protein [Jiangella mangrovi]
MTRGADGVVLYVDGVAVASGAPVPGSVTTDAAVGLHLGQRPDGANQLLGDLDDVWLLGRAASAAEIAALAAGDAVGDPLVHLPLDEVSRAT